MVDIFNIEVKVGDTVVFNHPNYRLLEGSIVQEIVDDGIKVMYHNPDDTISEGIIPEKQFVIMNYKIRSE